jgi:hypothetical protein
MHQVKSARLVSGPGVAVIALRSVVRKGSPLRSDRCGGSLRSALTDASAAGLFQ